MRKKTNYSSGSKKTGDGRGICVTRAGCRIQTDQSPKCWKSQKELSKESGQTDHISNLPNKVLFVILSFLPMKGIVKSSVLSKRWRGLWKSVCSIDFRKDDSVTNSKFIDDVNKFMDANNCSKINKLSIHLESDDDKFSEYESDVDKLVLSAVKKEVEDLCLQFKFSSIEDFYRLPQTIYPETLQLVSLKLSCCFWNQCKVAISWIRLKNILLQRVFMDDKDISQLLSGCPSLEVMELIDFFNIRNLDICSSRLKRLKLENFARDDDGKVHDYELKISAPNLKSLEISGDLAQISCELENVSSLDEAGLIFHLSEVGFYVNYNEQCKLILKDLLKKLEEVGKLKIGAWCIWILSELELSKPEPQVLNVKLLTLCTEIARWDLPGIARLLLSSPHLETLVIQIDSLPAFKTKFLSSTQFLRSYDYDARNYFKSNKNTIYLLDSLKTVQIIDFGKRFYNFEHAGEYKLTFEFELVQFLLENARNLEKMDIKLPKQICDNCTKNRRTCYNCSIWYVPAGLYRQVTTKLSSFKCSSNARVNVLDYLDS